jgi:hypothetical protein
VIQLANGGRHCAHGLDPEIARMVNTMTKQQVEELAVVAAKALTDAWGGLPRDEVKLRRAMGAELERAMGVEPMPPTGSVDALPLSYTRAAK